MCLKLVLKLTITKQNPFKYTWAYQIFVWYAFFCYLLRNIFWFTIQHLTMKETLREQKLVFVSILFALLLSFPFLKMMNKSAIILGVPSLFLYVFVTWALLIACIWLVIEGYNIKSNKRNE